MKIGIITFHFVSNQGGVLQSYALQKALEKLGYESKIIDYRPSYHAVRYAALKNPFRYARGYWKRFRNRRLLKRIYLTVRSFFRCVILNVIGSDASVAKEFDRFISKHMYLTNRYASLKQLQKKPPVMDAYISGSDQLWNPDVLDSDFDPAYFLDFGSEKIPKITYAVSTGRSLHQEELIKLHSLCNNLSAISMREYDRSIEELLGREVSVCVDPTLLLEEKDYVLIESQKTENEPYIFVYGFEDTAPLQEAIKKVSDKYLCRIINGSSHRINVKGNVQKIRSYGPDQFLSLIKNAKCVVTNSFHGTVFSIIYQKKFVTVPHTTRGGRMTVLLKNLELNQCLWGSQEFSLDREVDYSQAYVKLERLKEHSYEFLCDAILGKRSKELPSDRTREKLKADKEGDEKAYYGYFLDRNQLSLSSSGGAATILAESIVDAGGVVFGVAYSKDFKSAHYCCAETRDDLERLKGSKYIFPELCYEGERVFDIVEKKLCEGRKVLFIGLGCIVAGLLNTLDNRGIDKNGLYTIDLICHGPTTQNIQSAYIDELELRYKSQVVSFTTRYKKGAWSTPYIKVIFKNGKKYIKALYETDFGFALKTYCKESCYSCRFKGGGHVADITVGDYWGLKPNMQEYNKDGVSIFITRTERGDSLINNINSKEFFVETTDIHKGLCANQMYYISAKQPKYYTKFKNDLQHGLHYAVIHSPGIKRYIKAAIKNRALMLIGKK